MRVVDKWVSGCRVNAMDWFDNENIYMCVEYFRPGQSLSQPPAWEKTVYIKDNAAGRNVISNFLDSLVNYICGLDIPIGGKANLEF